MKTRTRAGMLALTAALALGACSKAPEITATSQATNGAGTHQTADAPNGGVAVSDPGQAQTDPGESSPQTQNQTVNAQAKGALTVKAGPDDASATVTRLDAKTKLGSKTTLLVLDRQGDWLQVALPIRPNGSSGWVKASDVNLRTNDYVVKVDLGAKKITITKGGQTVLESPVAVGTNDTPTPAGTYYITDFLQNENPKDAYGPYAFGLSGHSEKLTEFAGGDGQIGIHGTNDPSSIGKAVSHGCVRLPNDVITKMANMTPLGTPVTIA